MSKKDKGTAKLAQFDVVKPNHGSLKEDGNSSSVQQAKKLSPRSILRGLFAFGRLYGSVLHALVPGRMSDSNVKSDSHRDMRSYGSVLHALVPGRMSVMSGFLRDVFVLSKIITAAGLKHKHRVLIGLLAVLLPVVAVAGQLINPAPASAAINEQLNFQARLLNDAGGLVPDGNYHVRFRIYEDGDGSLGGGDENLVWTETHTIGNLVRVANGYLTVQLGSINNTLDSAVDWGNDTLWLSIEIGGSGGSATWDGEMDPMMRLTSTPYAFNANNLDGRDSSEFVQLDPDSTQAVNSTSTAIDVNQTGSGNVLRLQAGGSDAFTINNSGNAAFNNDVTIGDASSDRLTVTSEILGASALVFQGATDDSFTTTLSVGDPTADTTYVLPAHALGGTYEICTTDGNCSDSGITIQAAYNNSSFGIIILDDTRGAVRVRDNATPLGTDLFAVQSNDGSTSYLSVDASGVSVDGDLIVTGDLTVQNTADSTTAYQFLDADGGVPVLNIDTTNERVGVGTDAPGEALDVAGSLQLSGGDGNGLTTIYDQLTFTADSDNDGTADLFRFRGNGITDYLVITNTGGVNLGTYDCSGNANGGVLTVDASGNVVCDDDDDSAASVTLQNAYDATAGATPEVVLDATRGAFTIRDNATPLGANLLEIQDNTGTTTYLAVDASGTSIDGTLLVTGQTDVQGDFSADGNVALGDADTDTLTVNATLQGGSPFIFEGVTDDGFETTLAIEDPTADRTITLPDEIGTVCLQNSSNCGFVVNADLTLQQAYDNGSTLATTDNRDIVFTLADTTTDSDFIVNLQGTGNQIIFQDGGTNVFTLSDGGQALFQNSSNSSTAFRIQDAGGTNMFQIDTTNNRVHIGDTTADSTGTILVLDTKNTAGDPTGVNGAMYYNSSDGKFRCYEGGEWGDCGTLPQTGFFIDSNGITLSDSNTDLWQDATYPNLDKGEAGNTVVISIVLYGSADGNDDESNVYTVHRAIDQDPDCNDTQIGTALTNSSNRSGQAIGASGTFVDNSAGAGNVRYTICSSTDSDSSNSTVNNNIIEITFTLQESG